MTIFLNLLLFHLQNFGNEHFFRVESLSWMKPISQNSCNFELSQNNRLRISLLNQVVHFSVAAKRHILYFSRQIVQAELWFNLYFVNCRSTSCGGANNEIRRSNMCSSVIKCQWSKSSVKSYSFVCWITLFHLDCPLEQVRTMS